MIKIFDAQNVNPSFEVECGGFGFPSSRSIYFLFSPIFFLLRNDGIRVNIYLFILNRLHAKGVMFCSTFNRTHKLRSVKQPPPSFFPPISWISLTQLDFNHKSQTWFLPKKQKTKRGEKNGYQGDCRVSHWRGQYQVRTSWHYNALDPSAGPTSRAICPSLLKKLFSATCPS